MSSFLKAFKNPLGMVDDHKIVRIIKTETFLEMIEGIKEEQIIPSKHSFFRLSEGERNVFKDEVIKEIIKYRIPSLVGIQKSGVYVAFYNYGKKLLRVMLDIKPREIRLVIFYAIDRDEIPRL